jgi:PadR family transcriptional regulator, regulatory protein PadR
MIKKPKLEIQNLTKNCNESLILAILYKEKKHGYQIALEIDQTSEGLFKLNHGTLYPILHRLEKEGLIKGTWKQEGPKRKRKYYSITAKGRKHVNGQLAQWKNFYEQFFEIMGEIEK